MTTTEQIPEEYQRQWDITGDLRPVEVWVVGVGAIGRQVALQLASMGVGAINLADPDTVERVNLGPQGYRPDQIGESKVSMTARDIRSLRDQVGVWPLQKRFTKPLAQNSHFPGLFICVDSIRDRERIFNWTEDSSGVLIDGRMLSGNCSVLFCDLRDKESRKRYADSLFDQSEAHEGRCTSRSTLYTANVVAGLMVNAWVQARRDPGMVPSRVDLSLNSWEMDAEQAFIP